MGMVVFLTGNDFLVVPDGDSGVYFIEFICLCSINLHKTESVSWALRARVRVHARVKL